MFEVGDVIEYGGEGSEAYIVDINRNSLCILFFDGSIGWHDIQDSNFKRTSKNWDSNKLRNIIELGFSKGCRVKRAGYIDNLTYIELLAWTKEYAEQRTRI